VGAGPNGLAAAITLARAGRSVLVLEAAETVGGGTRSAELTLPGFVHDVCSTAHPLALGSPFLSGLPLAEHGLELVHPPAPLAHPLDDGTAVLLERSVAATARGLGPDAEAYRRMMEPLVRDAERLLPQILGPLRPPRHPLVLARFGLDALSSANGLARRRFAGERARALFAGCAAHSILSLRRPVSASFGLVLALLGHTVGWPLVRGGSQRLADALSSHLRSLGGEIETGRRIGSLAELADARAVLLDLTPRQVLELSGDRLPDRYRRALGRYRYARGCSSSTGRSADRSRGGRLRRHGRGRSISAGRSRSSSPPRRSLPAAATPSDRTCCSFSRPCSTAIEHPTGNTPPGPTVTCRTARPAT